MALDFPPTAGEPTDGSFRHTENTPLGSVTYAWNGTYWYSVFTSDLNDLDDVEVTDAKQDDILVYKNTLWQNQLDLQGGSF